MPTARSSAGIARPASAGRVSGNAHVIMAKRNGLPLLSTPPKSPRRAEESVMKMQTLALAFLAAAAIGGLAWVFLYPLLSGQKNAENRRAIIARPEQPSTRQADKNQRSRREQVEGSLKEIEARRQKDKKVSLS